MQLDTMAEIKAGKHWDDIHLTAHKVAIDGLLKVGILKGDAKEILEARTSTAFFPHGLGHHLGMDTHDVGGQPKKDDKDVLFRYLRLRTTLPAGSVVTVEPGVSNPTLFPFVHACKCSKSLTIIAGLLLPLHH
jgi:Xaa-Pro dipeptidase